MADEDVQVPAPKAEPRPTQAALRKKPYAVIFAEWVRDADTAASDLSAITNVVSHTFEWFQNADASDAYYVELVEWSNKTVNDDSDETYFFIGQVGDTTSDPVSFTKWTVIGKDRDRADVYAEAVRTNENGPNYFVIPSKPRAGDKTRVAKVKVKAKKPSPAAGLVQVEAKSKRKVVPKGKVRARKPNADVAALKERLKGELVGMGVAPAAADEALSPADDKNA